MRGAVVLLSFPSSFILLLQTISSLNDAEAFLDLAAPPLLPEVILNSSVLSWLRIDKCADACGGQKKKTINLKSLKCCSAHVDFPRKNLRESKP